MTDSMKQALRKLVLRLLALALVLVLGLQLLPVTPIALALEEIRKYSDVVVSPDSAKPTSQGVSVTNTYLMEVSTGSVRSGGTADNVLYFVIYYTTAGGPRSTVIFPGKDGISRGMDVAHAVGNRDSRRQSVEETFGYTTAPLREEKGLGSVQTDQFLFRTPEPVITIDRIQIFGRMNEGLGDDGVTRKVASDWACQAMRIARVDTLYGEEMYGWYSEKGYIDYAGEIIADADMASGGGIFRWQNSGGVFNVVGPGVKNGVAGVVLVNTATAPSYSGSTAVGTKHESQASDRVVFRLDLADIGGAGLECLAGSYEAGARSTISALKFCECAALDIRYNDIYGCVREINLPLIVNALGWTMEQVGDAAIAGFAQQGDSVPVSAMLPDFESLKEVTVCLGEEIARNETGLSSVSGADQSLRPKRITAANAESIEYLCIAAYRNPNITIQRDSAVLVYGFDVGEGSLMKYYISGSVEGVHLAAGDKSSISLIDYREGMVLRPIDRRERYLITISTDNAVNSGSLGDVYLQVNYLDMDEKEKSSYEIRLLDCVQEFYGEWPGNVEYFAYRYGMRAGGTLQFFLPIQNVKQFRSVSLKLKGDDEWQFKGIQIQKVKSYGPRVVRWQEIDDQGLKSHLIITRDVAAQTPVFSMGTIYSEEAPPVDPADPEWVPGYLIQDDGQYHVYDGSSRQVDARDEIDWSSFRYYMSYEDTMLDLGFNRERCVYEVQVNVAGDKVNSEDDDCGSANLFYFQLLFEYGNSGCVLANQQLQADAFRTGAQAKFIIPTTQDYGNLTAIRIIPDNQDSNGDIYDKLKINSIVVRRQNTGKISPTWTADSESADGLGWVGIDYRDPGSVGSNQGAQGRSISELAHTFQINKSSYSTKLMFSIKTGNYASTPKENTTTGEIVTINDPILQGGMTVSFNYYDNEGKVVHVDPFDVVKLMDDYSGLPYNTSRTIDGVTDPVNFTVSSPDYQFRPGTSDKFFVDVDNISKIIDMQIQIRSSVVTKWNLEDVSVYLIQGSGTRYINANGEYDYRYEDDEQPALRCSWNREQGLVKDVQIYRTDQKDSIGEVNVTFEDNEFPAYDDGLWTATIDREPRSKDDTVNLFIYPSTESAASDPSDYGLTSNILYTESIMQTAMQSRVEEMQFTHDSAGRPVFYALGINTSCLDSITGVEVNTNTFTPVHAPISFAVLQHIRSGVLLDTYYLSSIGGDADKGVTLKIRTDPGGQMIQRVLLQVDRNQPTMDIVPEEKDLAVAVHFITDDAFGRELRTKYFFLSDLGYSEVEAGEVLELDFNITNLKEITGLTMVSMGRMNISFENGLVLEQNASGKVTGKWSFQGQMTPAKSPARFSVTGDVTLLDLELTTAPNDASISSGTTGPVSMVLGYYDTADAAMTRPYDDLRLYSDSPRSFQTDSTDKIRLLIPNMKELRWIDLEPKTEVGNGPATWRVGSLSAMTDLSGYPVTRVLNKLIQEGTPLRVSLADILISGLVSIIRDSAELGNVSGDYTIPTGGSLDLVLNPGEGVRVVPMVSGSDEGMNVVLNRLDAASGSLGKPDLQDTRGYTKELLEAYAQAAGPLEAAVWRSVIPDDGYWNVSETVDQFDQSRTTDYIVFLPPRNYTSESIRYRITMTSRENSAAEVCINLTVPPEPNPVPQMVSDAKAKDTVNEAAHVHSMVYTPAVPATCTEAGRKAFYSCAGCSKYFWDALGENEITDFVLTEIAPLGHNYSDWEPDNGGTTHSRTCSRCQNKETEPHNLDGTGKCTVCGYPKTTDPTTPTSTPTDPTTNPSSTVSPNEEGENTDGT